MLHKDPLLGRNSPFNICTLKDFICAKTFYQHNLSGCHCLHILKFIRRLKDLIQAVFIKSIHESFDKFFTTTTYVDLSFHAQRLTNCARNSHNSSNQTRPCLPTRLPCFSRWRHPAWTSPSLLSPISMQITPQTWSPLRRVEPSRSNQVQILPQMLA